MHTYGGRVLRAYAEDKKKARRSYSTAPTAGPGLRASDLARLARQHARDAVPKHLAARGDAAAVLEWRAKAAAAAEELRGLQRALKRDRASRDELESELRGLQVSQRAERSTRRDAEEKLQDEIDALRAKVIEKEREWSARERASNAEKDAMERELRGYQTSAREDENASERAVVELRRELAASAR